MMIDSPLSASVAMIETAIRQLTREADAQKSALGDIQRRREQGEITKHDREHLRGKVVALLTEIYGLLGSSNKRLAGLHAALGDAAKSKQILRAAAEWYQRGVTLRAQDHWTPCQAFVLAAVAHNHNNEFSEAIRDNWRLASDLAFRRLQEPGAEVWSYGTLVEVELWRPLLAESSTQRNKKAGIGNSHEYLAALAQKAQPDDFPLKSTLRQLRRYTDWWGKLGYIPTELVEQVTDLIAPYDDSSAKSTIFPVELPMNMAALSERVKVDEVLGTGNVQSVDAAKKDATVYFKIQMLPARQGDSLWIEYGDKDEPRRILIDGGFRTTVRAIESRIAKIAGQSENKKCNFELGVVSHIDADHIEGLIEMIGRPMPVSFNDLWFNGRKHLDIPAIETALSDHDVLGGKHGLFLDTALELSRQPWNKAFDGGTIVVEAENLQLPVIELNDDMKLTILSPTREKLEALAKRWDREVRKAGLDGSNAAEVLKAMDKLHFNTGAIDSLLRRKKPKGPLKLAEELKVPDGVDKSPANGSSIAFLADHRGHSCLFMADAHADAMISAINQLAGDGKRLSAGAVKLSHHASGNNVTLALLKRIDSKVFLISTNGGGGHYHPDRHAIAKLIAGDWRPHARKNYPLTLLFNYRNDYTSIWDDSKLKKRYNYSVHYADPGDILELAQAPKSST